MCLCHMTWDLQAPGGTGTVPLALHPFAFCTHGSLHTRFSAHTVLCTCGSLHMRFSVHAVLCTRGSLHMRFSEYTVLCTRGSLHTRFSVHAVLCTHGYCLPSPASHSSSLSAWSLCQLRFPSFFFLFQPHLVRVFSVIRGKCFRICLPMQET